jgi:hypothetical protein
MKKTIKRETHKLSLSSETLRTLTGPALARAHGGHQISVSYCIAGSDTGPAEKHSTDQYRSGGPTEGSRCVTFTC